MTRFVTRSSGICTKSGHRIGVAARMPYESFDEQPEIDQEDEEIQSAEGQQDGAGAVVEEGSEIKV